MKGRSLGIISDCRMPSRWCLAWRGIFMNAFKSFDATARAKPWCTTVDLNRTFIRLDDPFYKKYGGGHRVKRITIYDKFDKMVPGARAAVYGQEYTYTTQQQI